MSKFDKHFPAPPKQDITKHIPTTQCVFYNPDELPKEVLKSAATAVIKDSETKTKIIIIPTQPPESYGESTASQAAKGTWKATKEVGEHVFVHAPHAVIEGGGQYLASGGLAGVVGAGQVAYSLNKKRAALKVLPAVGIALIPGLWIPAAIGGAIASVYLVDKLYVKLESKDRVLQLERYWPTETNFSNVKACLVEWANIYQEIVTTFYPGDPEMAAGSQQVVDVIFWLLRSFTKLREIVLKDWQWRKMTTSRFAKNMKQLHKALDVSREELEGISMVVKEGADIFFNMAQEGAQMNQMLAARLQRISELAGFMEAARSGIKSSIEDAINYLKYEEKKLK